MNIYFYGGSFDPPHLGHKKIINYFLDKCDKFLIIPTHHSPLKEAQPISYFHRQEMLKLMFSNSLSKKVSIVDYELEIKSRYTADIVRLMKTKFPSSIISMVIGCDQLNQIEKWKEYNYIIDNVKVVVISRPNFIFNNQDYIDDYIKDMSIDISSSFIRENINNLGAIKSMLDEKVMDYITKNNLYI